jgi:hypothetical protein
MMKGLGVEGRMSRVERIVGTQAAREKEGRKPES